ncbi:MAG TPA: glycosyltransferase family 39 protein [Candidatus Hydrogenedentes bacterium]|nr:glycosyltransferase family 39 protein [Candidatus Hydrogenedentota bacterium]
MFFFELGRMDVCTDNEGQRVTPPIEMLASGNYVIPTINGVDYLTKPPALYWMIALTYRWIGAISEWTARIPTALCGLLSVLCLYLVARKELGEIAARWGAVILLTTPYFVERARWTEIDVPFTLGTVLTVSFFWQANAKAPPILTLVYSVLSGAAFGWALLLKGPPALLFFTAAVIASWVIWGEASRLTKNIAVWGTIAACCLCLLSWVLTFKFPLSLSVLIATWVLVGLLSLRADELTRRLMVLFIVLLVGGMIVAPWAAAVLKQRSWDYVVALLRTESLERTYLASEINRGSPFYYLIGIMGMFAPWSFLLPLQYSPHAWQLRPPFYRFCVIFGWLSIGFFSTIAGKEYEYILPAVPFLALTIGQVIRDVTEDHAPIWHVTWFNKWKQAVTPLLFVGLLGVASYFASTNTHILLRLEIACVLGIALAVIVLMRRYPSERLKAIALLSGLLILTTLVGRSYATLRPDRSPKWLGLACRDIVESGLLLETMRRQGSTQPFPYPAFAFYLRRPIPFEDAPEKVIEKLAGKEPYYYLLRKKNLNDVAFAAHRETYEVLLGPFDRKELVLIGNAPLPETPAILQAKQQTKGLE